MTPAQLAKLITGRDSGHVLTEIEDLIAKGNNLVVAYFSDGGLMVNIRGAVEAIAEPGDLHFLNGRFLATKAPGSIIIRAVIDTTHVPRYTFDLPIPYESFFVYDFDFSKEPTSEGIVFSLEDIGGTEGPPF